MIALLDCRINSTALTTISGMNIEPILMPPAPYLSAPVASHPDMLMFIGFDSIFCHEKYYQANQELIKKISHRLSLTLRLSHEPTDSRYPNDVLFNAVLLGNKLICNTKTVSGIILSEANRHKCEIIHVSQGYTKCSVAKVSDNAIITADSSIATACRSNNIDVLRIAEGSISLPGVNYGFIGGATGSFGHKMFFCGSLDSHPDADRIREFCNRHGKTPVSLDSGDLHDVGSIFIF